MATPSGAPMPLRSWMKNNERAPEIKRHQKTDLEKDNSTSNNDDDKKCFKESIIRRTTIAYGIAELLKHSTNNNGALEKDDIIRIDNFVVSVSSKRRRPSSRSWDTIKGVGMISSGMSLTIEEPSYLRGLIEGEDDCDDPMGRWLEVELASDSTTSAAEAALNNVEQSAGMNAMASPLVAEEEESNRCYLFARLLYELFTHEPFPDEDDDAASTKEPAQKRARKSPDVSSRKNLMLTRAKGDFDRAGLPFQISCIVHMQNLGIPASICLMTQNLLECALRGGAGCPLHNAYESIGVVCEDLHLLLLDPDRFLFENPDLDSDDMQLLYRTDKLYGRDKEETLITDAFCRVSRGKSEAFFIGGFSGSGKSMLVDCLRDRVNAVGGYVTKHKFDAMSQEKPLSGVISAINQVCQMIKDTAKPVIAKRLRDEFGVDFNLLVRLLPGVSALSPNLKTGEKSGETIQAQSNYSVNVRSVCFTLLRFVRVVSSPRHPIMLFLDDVQWADSTALDAINTILSDTMGSCMFFVGTYRDNEVQIGHPVFDLMEKLEISNVQTTKVSLAGLNQEDLNTMISDALCLYPRICRSLSDILFQKTKGNPFFLLEFMQSLKSRGLLQYNSHQKRWVWNEDIIRAEDITDNVLHLLSSKMNSLSDDVQMVLKVMACFGSSTHETVIGHLIEMAEYAGVRNGLEGALSDGFIVKNGEGRLQFVHDKVREAAYNLIPGSNKKEFHYQLGKVLNSSCGGIDAEDTIFTIASQINHGKEWIVKDKDLSIAIAELNMMAGKRALDGCDYKTAYSFLAAAISFLPEDHWESHYDLSLRLNSYMAGAATSCCQYDKAEQILRGISDRTRCFEDKLPSYYLLSQIFKAQGKVNDAYNTCSFVLLQLGETIPESVTSEAAKTMVEDTLKMFEEVYDDDWLQRRMEDETLRIVVKFYSVIILLAYFCRSRNTAIYFICKSVQLSLRNGVCAYTPLSLLQLVGFAMEEKDTSYLYHIAKNALSLVKRFGVGGDQMSGVIMNFYGRIAWRFEPFQVCGDHLRRGFESGLSSGVVRGFNSAYHAVKSGIISGEKLVPLLKEIDFYLHLLKTYKDEIMRNVLLFCRETVSVLIDKGEATSIEAEVVPINASQEPVFFHQAYRAFWSGYTVRCHYFFEKCSQLSGQYVQFNSFILKFYHGLNSLDVLKKKKSHITRYREVVRDAISAMKGAAAKSEWNFTNKLHLLEAEQQYLTKHHGRAIELYEASIECAKKSGFIHEQGLACEKAGFYFKNIVSNNEKALEYFKQALACYEEWGSSVKVAFIQKEIDGLNPNAESESQSQLT